MNYYEHHLGDWAKDTSHLTMLEEGAYRRLVDVYYIKEKPLPKAIRDIYKLARAAARAERQAVDAVLREFFQEREDGWHHKRCDEELARYAEGQEDAEGKRENDKERQRRARERRKQLFEQLRSYGIVPAWDTKTSDLEALLSRAGHGTSHTTGHAPVTPPVTRDNTATSPQSPIPNPQSPIHGEEREGRAPDRERDRDEARNRDGPAPSLVTPAAAAVAVMRSVGIARVNGSDARLLELLARGAGMDHLACAGKEAIDRKVRDPFAYALSVVESQLDKAQEMAAAARPNGNGVNGHGPPKRAPSRTEKQAETLAGLTGRSIERTPNADSQPSAIDVESRRVD